MADPCLSPARVGFLKGNLAEESPCCRDSSLTVAQTMCSPTACIPTLRSLLFPAAGAGWGAPYPRGYTSKATEAGWGQDASTSQSRATRLGCLGVPALCPTTGPAHQPFPCRGPFGFYRPFFTPSPFTCCQDSAGHGKEPNQAGRSRDEPQRWSSSMRGWGPWSSLHSQGTVTDECLSEREQVTKGKLPLADMRQGTLITLTAHEQTQWGGRQGPNWGCCRAPGAGLGAGDCIALNFISA